MDEDTLDVSDPSLGGHDGRGIALTLAWHPELSRVGEIAFAGSARAVRVGRHQPSFRAPDGTEAPLDLRAVSRAPVMVQLAADAVVVRRGDHQAPIEIDGTPLDRELRFDLASLDRGLVMELARRAVVVVTRRPAPSECRAPESIVGVSAALDVLRTQIRQVADLDVPVLLTGPSGTGKELVARALVASSARRDGPFVAVNLAATPPTMAASELFGHERGAFTGADRARRGLFEAAHGGTLFLDEIGDTPLDVQVALLRVLETGEVRPLGAGELRQVDVRVIAATDVDLEAATERGSFREALLQRLGGYRVVIPPLSARRCDVGPLLASFLVDEARALGLANRVRGSSERGWVPAGLVARLVRLPWRGNVRQLRNVVRQLLITNRDRDEARLDPVLEQLLELAPRAAASPDGIRRELSAFSGTVPPDPAAETARLRVVQDRASVLRAPIPSDDEALLAVLRRYRFELRRAARELGVSRSTLYARIERSSLIRKAKDLGPEEVAAAREAAGGDLDEMAARLEVSPRGLVLRMRELGISD